MLALRQITLLTSLPLVLCCPTTLGQSPSGCLPCYPPVGWTQLQTAVDEDKSTTLKHTIQLPVPVASLHSEGSCAVLRSRDAGGRTVPILLSPPVFSPEVAQIQ